jgi:hypothetical protein
MFIPGIVASTNWPKGDFESIATATLTSDAASISLSLIPSTYKHLQLRAYLRAASATTNELMAYRFNGVTANGNYRTHYIQGDGANATAGYYGETNFGVYYAPGNNSTANTFGAMIMDILDYADTNKLKTIRLLNGYDTNGNGIPQFESTWFNSTSAINSITFLSWSGSVNYKAGTTLALYGIKG